MGKITVAKKGWWISNQILDAEHAYFVSKDVAVASASPARVQVAYAEAENKRIREYQKITNILSIY